jgi:hypothetical protein
MGSLLDDYTAFCAKDLRYGTGTYPPHQELYENTPCL